METQDKKYIEGGLLYNSILSDIRKSRNVLQPLYEAITNSLESFMILNKQLNKIQLDDYTLTLRLYKRKGHTDNFLFFQKLVVEDNGVGFDTENFERLTRYRDNRKGFNNKGSGRIQFVHFFEDTTIESFYEENSEIKGRKFTLSKSPSFLQKNSILLLHNNPEKSIKERKTTITFKGLLDEKDQSFYNEIDIYSLKKLIISRYIYLFCSLDGNIPKIKLEEYTNEILSNKEEITDIDIPKYESIDEFKVPYSTLEDNKIVKINKVEVFSLSTFLIDNEISSKHDIKFTSKNELVVNSRIKLDVLDRVKSVNGKYYLFLISGDYIDQFDSDPRGDLQLLTANEFREKRDLFESEVILLDDIEEKSLETIVERYPNIKKEEDELINRIQEIKKMFLIKDDIIKNVKISPNDSEEKILHKFYKEESRLLAKGDSEIKEIIDDLRNLNPTDENYEEEIASKSEMLTMRIPIQNRNALTQYVARRKLVLDLFSKILNRELLSQNENNQRNIDEKLLHNLIFRQHSTEVDTSDLWLLNEDYILFSGSSEAKIQDIEYKGERIIKSDEELTKEQIEARDSLGMRRYQQRLDVILFPEEGKCVILEFKSPEVSLADHLTQIQNYATLIRNFSKDKYDFTTFYGYLIGEKANLFEIRNHDPNFREAQYFDYFYKPASDVAGYWKKDGVIYTEIIKYSTLLSRAQKRNNIFIDKIIPPLNEEK